MPPPMFPQAGPAGPAAPPTGNPGEMASAMSQVRQAVNILEMALPKLQLGSEQHKACVDAIRVLSKAYPEHAAVQGIENTTLMGLQRNARQGALMQALMRMGGGGGAPGAGGPPMAGAGGPPMGGPPGM